MRHIDLVLSAFKMVLAWAFFHYALGCGVAVSAVLSLLVLHPLSLSLLVLLGLHELMKSPSFAQAVWIALPLAMIGVLHWLVDDTPRRPRHLALLPSVRTAGAP